MKEIMKRKICVVTGTRAEYGILQWLMKAIKDDPLLELQIVASGAHLSPEMGLTYKHIEADGFFINDKIEMLLSSDSETAISKSIGIGLFSIAESFLKLKPDIVVVLGDRYEILCPVIAAVMSRTPIAHIHGGEITRGVFDEQIRHAVTKMSHLHFTSTELYRTRIIQLGEDPNHVFNVGAPVFDAIKHLKLFSRKEFEERFQFKLAQKNILVTVHPSTLEKGSSEKHVSSLLQALDEIKDVKIIFTQSNADPEGRLITSIIKNYCETNKDRCIFFSSLGQTGYFSAMRHVDMMVGNSSSGIIEMPYFKKATVNIGNRQAGRLRAKTVIDCDHSKESILEAIKKGYSSNFAKNLTDVNNPYEKKDTSKNIKDILKKFDLKNILHKTFHDIPFN
jgi:UDP-hydrolysing UDP-N-acetyl-D-glucosamine 2-epimerase